MYEARIIARQGKTYIVENQLHQQYECHARSQAIDAVCGDFVQCIERQDTKDVVEKILPRINQITRIDNFKREKTLAANIDHLLVVIAPSPAFSTLLIDKYLACAELNRCKVSLVINKAELINDFQIDIKELESIYKNLVNQIFITSAKLGYGIATIRNSLLNETSIMVGQSGVGKSSIINRLLNNNDIKVSAISEQIQQGRHTTSNAYAHTINHYGKIIDSPGVRTFTPVFKDQKELAKGFTEFKEYIGKCKFNDCQHINEPGCTIIKAVSEKKIHASRYQNYLEMHKELNL